eukprot:Nitzschia sp. Nitz4//scaffold184_size43902//1875//3278//NITZ4_007278-RA/size43902-snap-gene-0.25-mRNA-1//1//CDS//3329539639//24//frame0
MRFAIAVALLGRLVPASAQDDNVNFPRISNDVKIVSLPETGKGKSPLLNRSHSLLRAAMRNKLTVHDEGHECKLDVGILSCGIGMYCKSDQSSSQEGVCAPVVSDKRVLGEWDFAHIACEADSEFYDCDCTEWDADTGTGKVTCNLSGEPCTYVCPDVCVSLVLQYSHDGDYWMAKECKYFTTPYEQVFCYTYASYDHCELSLDGVACNYCTNKNVACGYYDCTNVGMGTGDLCQNKAYDIPILAECSYTDSSYEPCYLCSGGVIYPDNMVDDAVTGSVSCGELGLYAQLGFLGEADCSRLFYEVQETCCGAGVYKCNICGEDGGYITTADANVDIPGIGVYSCAELDSESLRGMLTPELCPSVQQLAHEPCGCMAALATPDHTSAPNFTDAPSSSPSYVDDALTEAPTVGSGVASASIFKAAVACCAATTIIIF